MPVTNRRPVYTDVGFQQELRPELLHPSDIILTPYEYQELLALSHFKQDFTAQAIESQEPVAKSKRTNQPLLSCFLGLLLIVCFFSTANSAAVGERTYKRAGVFSGTTRHERSPGEEMPEFVSQLPAGYIHQIFNAVLHSSGRYTYTTNDWAGFCAVCDVGPKYYEKIFELTSFVNETRNGFVTTCPRYYHIYRNESLVIIEHFVSIQYPNATVYNTTLPILNFNGRLDCGMVGYTTITPAVYYDSPEGVEARTEFSAGIITGILVPHVEVVRKSWLSENWKLILFYVLIALATVMFVSSFNPWFLVLLALLYLLTSVKANYVFMHELEVRDGLLDWQGVLYHGQQMKLTDNHGRMSILTFNFTDVAQRWKIDRIYPAVINTEVKATYGCHSKPNTDSCVANSTTACGYFMGTVYNKGIGPVHMCAKVGMIYANCEVRNTVEHKWEKYLHVYDLSSEDTTHITYYEELQHDEHISNFDIVADVISYESDAPERIMFDGVTGRYHANPFTPDDHCYATGYVDNVGFMDFDCLGISVTSFNGQTCGIKVTKNAYKTVTSSAPMIPITEEAKINFQAECFGLQCNLQTHYPVASAHVRMRISVATDFVPINHVATTCSVLSNNITRVGEDNFLYALIKCDEFGQIDASGATIHNIVFLDANTASIHLKCIYCAMAKIKIDEVVLDVSKEHVDLSVIVDNSVHFFTDLSARVNGFFGGFSTSWLTSWMSKLGNTVKIVILAVVLTASVVFSIYSMMMFGWIVGGCVLALMLFIDFVFYFYAFHA